MGVAFHPELGARVVARSRRCGAAATLVPVLGSVWKWQMKVRNGVRLRAAAIANLTNSKHTHVHILVNGVMGMRLP